MYYSLLQKITNSTDEEDNKRKKKVIKNYVSLRENRIGKAVPSKATAAAPAMR